MRGLSDAAVARLRETIDMPDAGSRFTVHELLGRGGMGAVYRATDNTLERDVAIKVLNAAEDSSGIAARLAREARVLAKLEHPGIVAVHDAGNLEDGRPFYVMRLIQGRRLDEHSANAGRGELLRVFLRICDAVSYAHARDVIHRDLTPSNVMVGEFGDVLVLDWGVAKVTGENALPVSSTRSSDGGTADGVVVGTPGFMSPEQASGSASTADARSDVYGLGAILRFVLSASGTAVPRPLSAIANKATEADPASRYQTVEALAAEVKRWLDGESVQAYRERAMERIGRLYRRNQALVLLLAAYAVVRVTILLWRGV